MEYTEGTCGPLYISAIINVSVSIHNLIGDNTIEASQYQWELKYSLWGREVF